MSPWLGLSAFVVIADQITKYVAEAHLTLGVPEPVIAGFFDLRLAYNPGAAFSLFGDADGWQRWFFIVLALGVSTWLVVWLHQLGRSERLTAAGIALLIGGALGNVWDRIAPDRLMVVDFLDFHVAGWSWPTFNVADIAISAGAIALVYTILRESRESVRSD